MKFGPATVVQVYYKPIDDKILSSQNLNFMGIFLCNN